MKSGKLRIAIVGCGTAGPAAAVLLKRQGHEVVLFERAEECKAVGAGFLLQPSGMVVLRELGILDEVLAHAAKVDRLHVLDVEGDTLLDLDYRELGKGSFGAGLHRPVLLHHLIECMRQAGVEVRWGWEIDDAVRMDGRWTVHGISGEECGGFDLLIVADGALETARPCRDRWGEPRLSVGCALVHRKQQRCLSGERALSGGGRHAAVGWLPRDREGSRLRGTDGESFLEYPDRG